MLHLLLQVIQHRSEFYRVITTQVQK
jgi:hypothetical protein